MREVPPPRRQHRYHNDNYLFIYLIIYLLAYIIIIIIITSVTEIVFAVVCQQVKSN